MSPQPSPTSSPKSSTSPPKKEEALGSHTSIKSQTSLLYFAASCAPNQSIRQHQSPSSSSSSSPLSLSLLSSPTSISSPASSTLKPSSTEISEIEDENVQQPEETSEKIPNQRMLPITTPISGWDHITNA
ncbi:putative protein TPRXL [Lucilia cuprina]|uniref:putative protein TPRXL n=1 Tax=Lucilia cuprina TaxID=7375 RepID=UPI001F0506AE|nr:putative protein TPRXL [Lucilia cuprina]